MLSDYFPILLLIMIGFVVGGGAMLIGRVLGPSRPDAEKNSPYECGFTPFQDARVQFDVRYYLVAILFILFDLEVAFLFPWALVYKELLATEYAMLAFGGMMVFLLILLIGFIYEWKKGALEWE